MNKKEFGEYLTKKLNELNGYNYSPDCYSYDIWEIIRTKCEKQKEMCVNEITLIDNETSIDNFKKGLIWEKN